MKKQSKEFHIHLNSPTSTHDLSPFLDRLHEGTEWVKLRLDAFSVSIENTGTSDFFTLSLKTNAFSPFVIGDDSSILYRASLYITAGNVATANDLGSETKYLIVSAKELRKPFAISWLSTVLGTGISNIRGAYAKLSLHPMGEDDE